MAPETTAGRRSPSSRRWSLIVAAALVGVGSAVFVSGSPQVVDGLYVNQLAVTADDLATAEEVVDRFGGEVIEVLPDAGDGVTVIARFSVSTVPERVSLQTEIETTRARTDTVRAPG